MVRAVTRALSIFEAFDVDHLTLSLQEIAQRTGTAKATAFRLASTLERAGYLVRLENQRYCISRKVACLAGLVQSTLGIREFARPLMLRLSQQTGETITINTVEGHERLCIDSVDTPAPLMSIIRPGERVPLLFGATAKILLAFMNQAEVDEVLAGYRGGRRPKRDALMKQLALFRRQGFALTSSERVPGVTAIAVPIRDHGDRVRFSLALTGPSVRVDPRQHELVELVLAAGRELSSKLGGNASG